MKHAAVRAICRFLVVVTLSPFGGAHAGMIGTGSALAGAVQERAVVSGSLARSDVAAALAALGVDPQSAGERVAAMTDAEVRSLAGEIQALPAGGTTYAIPLVLAAIIAAAILYRYK
jgi:hypothetical protein